MLAGARDRARTFFSRARWRPDILGVALSHLIVRRLLPEDAPLTVAVDDTLFKRRGKKVFGTAWQHDGSAQGPRPIGRGTCFVVVGIIVQLSFLERPVFLPVMARLWRPKQEQSKVDLAAGMLGFLAACHHGRRVHVVADAAYHGTFNSPSRLLAEAAADVRAQLRHLPGEALCELALEVVNVSTSAGIEVSYRKPTLRVLGPRR